MPGHDKHQFRQLSCPFPPKSTSPSSAPAPPASAPRTRWKTPASRSSCWRRATASAAAATPFMASPEITFDVGCGWLHSADKNSFVTIAERLDFEIDKTRPPWGEQAFDGGVSAQRSAPTSSTRWTSSTIAPRRPPASCNERRRRRREQLSRARQSLESDDRRDLDLCERLRARPGLAPRHGRL